MVSFPHHEGVNSPSYKQSLLHRGHVTSLRNNTFRKQVSTNASEKTSSFWCTPGWSMKNSVIYKRDGQNWTEYSFWDLILFIRPILQWVVSWPSGKLELRRSFQNPHPTLPSTPASWNCCPLAPGPTVCVHRHLPLLRPWVGSAWAPPSPPCTPLPSSPSPTSGPSWKPAGLLVAFRRQFLLPGLVSRCFPGGLVLTLPASLWKWKWKSLSHVMTLHDPMGYSLAGSSVHGILQARILELVAIPSPGDLPNPAIKPGFPTLQTYSLSSKPPGKLPSDCPISTGLFKPHSKACAVLSSRPTLPTWLPNYPVPTRMWASRGQTGHAFFAHCSIFCT